MKILTSNWNAYTFQGSPSNDIAVISTNEDIKSVPLWAYTQSFLYYVYDSWIHTVHCLRLRDAATIKWLDLIKHFVQPNPDTCTYEILSRRNYSFFLSFFSHFNETNKSNQTNKNNKKASNHWAQIEEVFMVKSAISIRMDKFSIRSRKQKYFSSHNH